MSSSSRTQGISAMENPSRQCYTVHCRLYGMIQMCRSSGRIETLLIYHQGLQFFRRIDQRRDDRAISSPSLSYFFSSLDRLFHVAYTPTDQDIRRLEISRQTSGVSETTFKFTDREVIIVDVGHCGNERRKWIHQFSDVTSILFVVNLSGYDECLAEDRDAVGLILIVFLPDADAQIC